MFKKLTFLLLVVTGCQIAPDNAFDPETDPRAQAPATVSGTVSGREARLEQALVVLGADDVNTDADGTFSFSVTPGEYTLEISHPAHSRALLTLNLLAGEARVVDVTLDELQDPGEDAGQISGRALLGAQVDHSGINVEVEGAGVRATTNSAGQYDLFLAPGAYTLVYEKSGFQSVSSDELVVVGGERTEVDDVTLSGVPGSVTGVVRLEDQSAADAAGGTAVDLVGGGSATTQDDGSYTIADVPAGTYVLSAQREGYVAGSLGFVVVEAGQTSVLPELVLEVSRGTVTGVVQKAGADDHTGIFVQVVGTDRAALTGADGSFAIEGVREATYTVRASADGFQVLNVPGVLVVENQVADIGAQTLAPAAGDFTINGGAPFTTESVVALELETEQGVVEMRISEDVNFADAALGDVDFRAVDLTPDVTLSAGDGQKTIFVEFRDDQSVVSGPFQASITLDTTPPVVSFVIDDGAAFTNDAGGLVSLTLSASDETSGVGFMQISNDDVFDEPLDLFQFNDVHTLQDASVDGLKEVHVRVRDFAGNFSAPVVQTITRDTVPPVVSALSIDCGGEVDPAFCTTSLVTISTTSSDAVSIALANDAVAITNAPFLPFAEQVAHLLAPGEGSRTVFARVRDAAGNTLEGLSDDVSVDLSPPSFPSIALAGPAVSSSLSQTVNLSAQGATTMRVAFDGVIDTEVAQPFQSSLTGDVPSGEGQKRISAVFLDDAGNASDVVSALVVLDTLPPAALSVELDGGAAFTTSLAVTVSAIASEASEMQVRTDDTFDSEPFVPVAATSTALLPAGQCAALDCKTVCVRFRDDAQNVSAPLCDTITFDALPPAIPVISTPAQVTANTTFSLSLAGEPADDFFAGYEMVIDPGDQGVFQTATATGDPPTFANLTLSGGASTANLIRVRAVDQAGNRSPEAALTIVVDEQDPQAPVTTVLTDDVNADTYAVFFAVNNPAADDANFSHYEIAIESDNFTKSFSPTALTDGLIFSLDQGNDTSCNAPCENRLFVRAVDEAGRVSPEVQVTVQEDSTTPAAPVLAPRGASITGFEVRMAIAEASADNGGVAPSYEVVGGDIPAFTTVGAASTVTFTLDAEDTSHELCVRGKDAAGNVSTADCVVVEQRSSIPLADDGVDERTPDIFGDHVVFTRDNTDLFVKNLASGAEGTFINDVRGTPRISGNRDEAIVAVASGSAPGLGDGAFLVHIDLDTPDTFDLVNNCAEECATAVNEVLSVDVDGNDVVVYGRNGGDGDIHTSTVAQCLPVSPACTGTGTGASTLMADGGRDINLCFETDVRIANGVVVWCETTAGGDEVHRLRGGVDTIIATDVVFDGRDAHQPVVTSDHIFWASGSDLCRIDVDASVAGLVGCPVAQRVTSGIFRLTGGEGDRVAAQVGAQNEPVNAGVYDFATDELTLETDNIFEQEQVQIFGSRTVFLDRSKFNPDIVMRDRTRATWITANPFIQAGPEFDGTFFTWLDTRSGGIQIFGVPASGGQEIEITPPDEIIVAGDTFFGASQGKVLYAVRLDPAGSELYLQDIATAQRTLVSTSSGFIEAPQINPEGDRIVWWDPAESRVQTATLSGITVGAIDEVGPVVTQVRRMAIAGDTVVLEDGGPNELICADIGSLSGTTIDNNTRGHAAAVIPGRGLVATWGRDDSIFACDLNCGVSCSRFNVADNGEQPRLSSSGYMVWLSNADGDGQGRVGVYDFATDRRYKLDNRMSDTEAPIANPSVFGDQVMWSGFDFGNSDIFRATLGDP